MSRLVWKFYNKAVVNQISLGLTSPFSRPSAFKRRLPNQICATAPGLRQGVKIVSVPAGKVNAVNSADPKKLPAAGHQADQKTRELLRRRDRHSPETEIILNRRQARRIPTLAVQH